VTTRTDHPSCRPIDVARTTGNDVDRSETSDPVSREGLSQTPYDAFSNQSRPQSLGHGHAPVGGEPRLPRTASTPSMLSPRPLSRNTCWPQRAPPPSGALPRDVHKYRTRFRACAGTNTNRCPSVVPFIAIPTQIIIVRHRELVAIAGPMKTTTRMHLSPVRWCFAPLPYWSDIPRGPWLVCRHVFHRHHAVSGVGIRKHMIRAKMAVRRTTQK
jgi:hypothetical protein